MKANVKFNAEIAVGIYGIAVMSLSEQPAEDFKIDGECNCVKIDIENCGASQWWDWLNFKKPKGKGIYSIEGTGYFDEDSSDYSDIKLITSS